jgi:hypothetical protein
MDDIVKQAIAKWPNVPHCYGWLGLDARGRWYLRDDAVQAAGRFPEAKGSLLQHEKLIEFIERNYEADGQGQWFFQNGPQRVYVELEATPIVWRIQPDLSLVSHTGQAATARDCLLDEEGRVYLTATQGLGLVHTLDVLLASEAVERGLWSPREVRAADLATQYGYIQSPRALWVASGGGAAAAAPV